MNNESESNSHEEDVNDREEQAIPVIDEELVIGKRAVPIGAVQVLKHVEERTETIDMPLLREEVDIRRVVINRVVDRIPDTREEGGVTIIPLVEEEIVVTKRLILKEEIHLTRRRSVTRSAEQVVLRREHAEVTRVDSEGRAAAPKERKAEPPSRTGGRRNRILKD